MILLPFWSWSDGQVLIKGKKVYIYRHRPSPSQLFTQFKDRLEKVSTLCLICWVNPLSSAARVGELPAMNKIKWTFLCMSKFIIIITVDTFIGSVMALNILYLAHTLDSEKKIKYKFPDINIWWPSILSPSGNEF